MMDQPAYPFVCLLSPWLSMYLFGKAAEGGRDDGRRHILDSPGLFLY